MEDWDWLVARISKNINIWCNRLLSLAERYILIKSVLEGQSMYWMSMETIPQSILSNIIKLMFHFIWNGQKDTQNSHLCRWEVLSRPKKNDGWGFRNLTLFNTTLIVNMLSRVLTQNGIWHKVLKDKYLPNTTIINWFRLASHKVSSTSRMWTSLVRLVHDILHWLRWALGKGQHINIDKDKVLVLGKKSILSDELINILKQQNITVLASKKVSHNPTTLTQ